MRIDIDIKKSAVMESAEALSAYLARTLGNEAAAITDSDSAVVDPIWVSGVTILSQNLMEWSARLVGYGTLVAPYTTGDFTGTLEVPGNWDPVAIGSLHSAMHNYMVQFVLSGWLQLKVPDAAATYVEAANGCLAQVEACLLIRRRPMASMIHRYGRRGNIATIVLHRDEIMRDIQGRAWVIAHTAGGEHGSHLVADIGTAGNEQVSLRDVDLVWHELEDILFPYLVHDEGGSIPAYPMVDFGPDIHGAPIGGDHGFGGTGREGYDPWWGPAPHWHRHWPPEGGGRDFGIIDDAMPDQPEYEARLQLPEGVAESTVRYWRTLMHEYLVTQVLANWCALTYEAAAEKLALKVAQVREQLAISLSCRTKRVRRPMRPW